MKNLITIFAALSFAGTAMAQETEAKSETKAKIEDVSKDAAKDQAQASDEADAIITNRMQRAATGSLSKLSVATAWNFSGGSVEKPMAGMRPNITGAPGALTSQTLSGGINANYRLTTQDRLSAGFAVRWVAPFTDTANPSGGNRETRARAERTFARNNDDFDVNNPTMGYSRIGRLGKVQSITNVDATLFTTRFLRDLGATWSPSVSQTFLYEIGTTGLTIGAATIAAYTFYDKGETDSVVFGGETARVGDNSSDYDFGFYPFIEYVINDRLNLRTVAGIAEYTHLRTAAATTFQKNVVYQSVGLGISVSRDVFLYPNIQFIPENIVPERTNVAMSANINLF